MSVTTLEDMRRFEFYHCIEVADGVFTPGIRSLLSTQAPIMAELRRHDLNGKRVLDVGCRDGLFSFEAERKGASKVLGIDNDLSPGATEFLIPFFNSRVEMRSWNIYDFTVEPKDRFDLTIFAGVLYHLRMPFYGLRRVAETLNDGGLLLLESAILLSHWRHPFVYTPATQDSPYDPSSVTFFNHKAMMATLGDMGFNNIECRALVIPQTGEPVCSGWDDFMQGEHKDMADSDQIIIGRGTYIARRDRSMAGNAADLERYWFGTHSLNSNKIQVEQFMDRWRSS
jgi:SAM-dependent methyltransferase